MRLFLHRVLITFKQALSNTQAGISVGMITQLALGTQAKRRARGIALKRLALVVANDGGLATMACSARIARVHTACDDTVCIPRLIFAVAENATFHPVGPFRIATAAIRALFRSQGA